LGQLAVVALAVLGPGAGVSTAASDLVYRCYPNLCKIRPDGSHKQRLTRDGRPDGPVYAWLSASRGGKRLGISFGNDAYVANARGRRLGDNYRDTGGAVPVVQISPDGRTLATIEPTLELQPPPGLIGPPLLSQNPFLFTHGVRSRLKTTVARSIVSVGWLGGRLMRSDTADDPPYTQRICLLRTNSSFECERPVADDPGREVWDPAGSPNGRYVAAVSAPQDEVSGPIVLYSAATGRRVRTLSRRAASTPSWSPDGRWVAFTSGRSIYVVRASGGRARKVVKGVQPVWVPR
jgi:hypothetical protein